jgi:hypothetical protein
MSADNEQKKKNKTKIPTCCPTFFCSVFFFYSSEWFWLLKRKIQYARKLSNENTNFIIKKKRAKHFLP